METVWKDQLLGQKEQRESRHENRIDYLFYVIVDVLIVCVGIWIGVKKNNANR